MNELIFDWNDADIAGPRVASSSILFDETLRDGIQAPNVVKPVLEEKLRFIDHMASVGIKAADLGYPGASDAAREECMAMARYIADQKYIITPAFAGRTHPADIDAISAVATHMGAPVEAYLFIGVSPIRQYVEGWDHISIIDNIRYAATRCREGGLEFVLVLEDALRCTPEILEKLYLVAVELGVRRIALCDTVGGATPAGAQAIIRWSSDFFSGHKHEVAFDWHGHNDRGMALSNALAAADCGFDRVHGTVLGIGERAGNASLDQMIVNFYLEKCGGYDLMALRKYCEYASSVLGVEIPANYPAMGRDVFKTSAGVHASAILKAHEKGDEFIKDCVYSSIPARSFGREQEVQIDPSSGASNVRYWLTTRGYAINGLLINQILQAAKSSRKPLCDSQIHQIISASR